MKKLLVLALSALLVLGLATVSMAAATFSGEISVRAKGYTVDGEGTATDFTFGKMTLSGKLGDDLTGTLVFKGDSVTSATAVSVDEASLLFTEDWGTFKAGYYGWNNNIADILAIETGDIKTETTLSVGFALTDAVNLGLAYGYDGNVPGAYGADLGFNLDAVGFNVLYFHYADEDTAWGLNAKLKLGDVTPYVEYRNEYFEGANLVNSIVGATFAPANTPVSFRAEVDLDTVGLNSNPWGIRMEYLLEDGAKIRLQYKNNGTNGNATDGDTAWEVRLTAPF